MKLNFKPSKEKIDLLKQAGSTNSEESLAAMEALAAAFGPVIEQVLPIYASSALIYQDWSFDPNGNPTIPLDMFEDDGINTVRVWSQQTRGGLATSEVKPKGDYKFDTYRLDSAASIAKRVAREGNVSYVSKALERMAQELLRNQELNAWNVLLSAMASALGPDGNPQVMSATTAGVFQVDDFNRLLTKIDRLHESWVGGTPATTFGSKSMTDLFLSPELMEQIRAWAYNPMNTRGVPNSDESTAVPLPDAVRTEIYGKAGIASVFGVNLHKLNEFGVGQAYNTLFDNYYSGTPSFNGSSQQIALALNLNSDAFIRPVATYHTDIDVSSTVQTLVDDQFKARDEKVGWYTKLEEGRLVLDKKAMYTIIV
jgi:hypothetical protein